MGEPAKKPVETLTCEELARNIDEILNEVDILIAKKSSLALIDSKLSEARQLVELLKRKEKFRP